jgi:hypothetical protein
LRALLLVFLLALPVLAQTPGERGELLRKELANKPPLQSLVGEVVLEARLGTKSVGSLTLRTDIVEKDGEKIYRLRDRLSLNVEGLGRAWLRVETDLRADFTPLRVVLQSEEPRGRGVVSALRVELRQEDKGWARYEVRAHGAPQRKPAGDLGERPLVLTPPLGAGERLARLVPATLGSSYSLGAHDLETGLATRWRASVDEPWSLKVAGAPAKGFLLRRREGGALLPTWRAGPPGSPPLRMDATRLSLASPSLELAQASSQGPRQTLCLLLRALAAQDREGIARWLDLEALAREADSKDAKRFARVALKHFTAPRWLERHGLALLAAALPSDFTGELSGKITRVHPKGAPKLVFSLEQRQGRWRVISLPRLAK